MKAVDKAKNPEALEFYSTQYMYNLDADNGLSSNRKFNRELKKARNILYADNGIGKYCMGDYYNCWSGLRNSAMLWQSSYRNKHRNYFSYSIDVHNMTAFKRDRRACHEIQAKAKAIVKGKKSSYARARAIHDWIAKNIKYDRNYSSMYVLSKCWKNKEGVCQDYAMFTYLMMRAAGVPCRLVYSASMNHAWNVVKVGKKWYQVDTTWDSHPYKNPRKPKYYHKYFLKGSKMAKHPSYSKCVPYGSTKLPKVSSKAY